MLVADIYEKLSLQIAEKLSAQFIVSFVYTVLEMMGRKDLPSDTLLLLDAFVQRYYRENDPVSDYFYCNLMGGIFVGFCSIIF